MTGDDQMQLEVRIVSVSCQFYFLAVLLIKHNMFPILFRSVVLMWLFVLLGCGSMHLQF